MKLLAIDTSTESCSAALQVDGRCIKRYQVAPRQHAELILPMVDELLAEAGLSLQQLDALAFGRGPGAFTGLRVATGVIQGLAYSHDLPVIAISSLAALAQAHADEHDYLFPCFDARMNEIYCGLYRVSETRLVELVGEEQVIRPELLPALTSHNVYGLGTGWQTYSEILLSQIGRDKVVHFKPDVYPDAEFILPLAEMAFKHQDYTQASDARPVYLRNKVTN